MLLLLLGCAQPPPAKVAPKLTIGVAVPASGDHRAAGEQVVRGVRLAAGEVFAVLADDDQRAGTADRLSKLPEVMGVVAHVDASTARAQHLEWLRVRMPVVLTAPGAYDSVPRVIPSESGRGVCAAGLIGDVPFIVRTDGSLAGMAVAQSLKDAHPKRFRGQDSVAPADVANQAAKLRGQKELVVWTGDATSGGNFLRALREFSQSPFFAVGGEDPRFLVAVGSAGEGARVSSVTRPARDSAFIDAFRQKYGEAPNGWATGGYDAARIIIGAWETARSRSIEVTRSLVLDNVRGVVTTGSGGSMYLDEDLILKPEACQALVVRGGSFVLEATATTTTVLDGQAEAMPATPGEYKPKKKKKPEGEWLGLPPSQSDDPLGEQGKDEKIRTPGQKR